MSVPSLFDVPGWSVPAIAQASSSNSRKRKRPSGPDEDKVQAAEINVQKLLEKLDDGPPNRKKEKKKEKKLSDTKTSPKPSKSFSAGDVPRNVNRDDASLNIKRSQRSNKKKQVRFKGNEDSVGENEKAQTKHTHPGPSNSSETSLTSARHDKKSKKHKRHEEHKETAQHLVNQSSKLQEKDDDLTSLQAKMKQQLFGGRFRWINEQLYTHNSVEAERLMREDPKLYEEYHEGFRLQVTSWPSNPVDQFIESLSLKHPDGAVIVDLGCGDAALARRLIPKGYTVLSYDLVAGNPFVVATDICSKLPLPGSEGSSDEGHIVDVVVCSLSLMSTNWVNCIREAGRVLKTGGELMIAEVASRFTNVEKFTSLVSALGFRLISKDDSNTHFTTFDFKKTGGVILDGKEWKKLKANHEVLQPCEYKRR